jgi:hypothetical protein
MANFNRKLATYEEVQAAIAAAGTMGGAGVILKMDRRTFQRVAEEHGLYDGSQKSTSPFKLEDILAGKHPQYPTPKLSKRLVSAGLLKYECSSCGLRDWLGKPISLELNHKDGNGYNHALSNLELLCPNCHSQTHTYRNRKRVPS